MIAEDNVTLQWNISINSQGGEATAREEGSQEGICIKDLEYGGKCKEEE